MDPDCEMDAVAEAVRLELDKEGLQMQLCLLQISISTVNLSNLHN